MSIPVSTLTGSNTINQMMYNVNTIKDLAANSAGFVANPGSSTDNAVMRFDGTSGGLAQDSSVLIADDGTLSATQVDIDGGTIDGTTIGGVSAGAGTFTTVRGTTSGIFGASGLSTSPVLGARRTSGTTEPLLNIEAAIGAFTGTSIQASNTLGGADTFDLFRGVVDSDGDVDGPNTVFAVNGLGNVGIGTSSPAVPLHISSATPSIRLTDTDDNSDAQIGASAAGLLVLDADINNEAAGSAILFRVDGGSEKMRIDSSGNVGIGTTSPSYRFQIAAGTDSLITYAGSVLNNNIFFDTQNTSTGASAAVVQRLITSDVAGTGSTSADFQKTKAGALNINNYETDSAAYTAFGVGAAERMRIVSDGKVGIGRTPTTNLLEVAGTIESTSGGFKFPDGSTQSSAGASTGKAIAMAIVFG
jgi:hypothetical protein